MALKKQINLENGVVLDYHRITSINKITNSATIIEVSSYTSDTKRQEEAEAIRNGQTMNVYIQTTFINKEYLEDESIKDLYNYLKTTDMFKDAEDA